MDKREAVLLVMLSHSPSGSFKERWIQERIERTKRLLAKVETIYEDLLEFVDSGCSPFTVNELNDIIRELDFVADTVIRPSIQQLAALLAPAPVDDHASVPQDHDNGGNNIAGRRQATPDEEVIGGAAGTQLQIISRM